MAQPNPEAIKLPDELLVRYFRAGETDHITQVTTTDRSTLKVQLVLLTGAERVDHWRDLGGGLGYIPSDD